MVLQKSLPVPIGSTPNAHLLKSRSVLTSSLSTQLIVPSPPQTIILTNFLSKEMAFCRLLI